MLTSNIVRVAFSVLISTMLSIGSVTASSINFDDQGLTGPSLFASTSATVLNLNIDGVGVTISGGAVVTNATFLPGNTTSTYGTASFLNGGLNPIVIAFDQAINNLFLDIFHGLPSPTNYTVFDNLGTSRNFSLESNQTGSFETIGIASSGTIITILADEVNGAFPFDFFIDNIFFNEELPDDLVVSTIPLPAALPLYGVGLAVMGAIGWRRKWNNRV